MPHLHGWMRIFGEPMMRRLWGVVFVISFGIDSMFCAGTRPAEVRPEIPEIIVQDGRPRLVLPPGGH